MSIDNSPSSVDELAPPWQAPFGERLAAEARERFRDGPQDAPVFLVAVGGLDCQDLPMSGNLGETPALTGCPALRALLSCFTAPLGRVYLRATPPLESPSPRGRGVGVRATEPLASPIHAHSPNSNKGSPPPSGEGQGGGAWQAPLPSTMPPPPGPLPRGGGDPAQAALLCYHPPCHGLLYHTLRLSLTPQITLLVELRRGQDEVTELFDQNKLDRSDQGDATHPDEISLHLAKPRLDLLPPSTVDALIEALLPMRDPLPQTEREALTARLAEFSRRWRECHQRFGDGFDGEWAYASALNYLEQQIAPRLRPLLSQTDEAGREDARQALDTLTSQLRPFPPPPRRVDRQTLARARRHKPRPIRATDRLPRFDRPIFIVSAPRAGSTLLFETLCRFRELWTTGEENHESIEAIPGLHPKDHGFHSNRLLSKDATPEVREALMAAFCARLRDRDQRYYLDLPLRERPARIRFLEKTPKNALRIPFLQRLFPDALFVHLQREREANLSSLIEGWRSRRFIAYRDLPGLPDRHWSFLLIPGWRKLHDKSLAVITERQWRTANRIISEDLARLPADQWMKIEYNELISDTEGVLDRFARFASLTPDAETEMLGKQPPRVSRLTLSAPQPDKWKKHAHLIGRIDDSRNT